MKQIFTILGLIGIVGTVKPVRADIILADRGKSTFSIVLPPNPPSSVQAAAQELQKDISLSTGATLPIVQDSEALNGNIISLGLTKQARQAEIFTSGIAEEGFRIITKNQNVYIIGPDTADGAITDEGGTSNGTANGVYTFLENYLGVRWLMPGDLGRDVPVKSTFTVPEINDRDAPFFIYRSQGFSQNGKPAVKQWSARQKLGYSFRIEHRHNWEQTITPDYYKDHPEWFAMKNGKRAKPSRLYKLETTNTEMVQLFAEKAIEELKRYPEKNTFSLSPSDGRGWSDSPESKALYDPIPKGWKQGWKNPSVTPMILKFYHDVAQIVARDLPSAKLAGYIYDDYLFPPQKGNMTLPANFYPVIAPSIDYGYRLYRPEVQEIFNNLLMDWSKVTPHLFYYDLPNRITWTSGLVTPMAPEILNFIFPRLVKNNVKGLELYGHANWTQSSMSNYVQAKMMWNPHLDAYQLQREWLQRAYGEAAGAKMELLYQNLDKWFADFYRSHDDVRYKPTPEMYKEVYADHYPELDKLFQQAQAQEMTPVQRQRLQWIKSSIVILQWRLENNDLLPADFKPAMQVTDDDVAKILATRNSDFNPFPTMLPSEPRASDLKSIQITGNLPQGKSTFALSNSSLFLIRPTKDGVIRLLPRAVNHSNWVACYLLIRLGKPRKIISSGMLRQGQPIDFPVKAGQNHYLFLPPFGHSGLGYPQGTGYQIDIEGAAITKSTFNAASKTLYLEDTGANIYVYGNPKNLSQQNSRVTITNGAFFNTHQYKDVSTFDLTKAWHFLPDAADGKSVAETQFDDGSWNIIDAGNWWQQVGYPDYHGKAWYRKAVELPALAAHQKAFLQFDGVDGSCQVYVNGKKVGEHLVAKNFAGWDESFSFDISDAVVSGPNVIAVQVTSKSQDTASGINQPVRLVIGTPK